LIGKAIVSPYFVDFICFSVAVMVNFSISKSNIQKEVTINSGVKKQGSHYCPNDSSG